MICIDDNVMLTAEEISEALKCTPRTAADFLKAHGGRKICGSWVILGKVFRAALEPVQAEGAESESGRDWDVMPRRSL